MLMDKGFYDYDYVKPEPKKVRNISKVTDPDKLAKKLARLGFAPPSTASSDEEAQAAGLEFIKNRSNK